MAIDVIINSCARPDFLEISVKSFQKYVRCSEDLRYILIEDRVADSGRRQRGLDWIRLNRGLFDQIILLEDTAGKGFWWYHTLDHCSSDVFIHLEDDCEFLTALDLDPLIALIRQNEEVSELIFNRGPLDTKVPSRKLEMGNRIFFEFELLSIASGVFSLLAMQRIIALVGRETRPHESTNLYFAASELGYKQLYIASPTKHYRHNGCLPSLRKGGSLRLGPFTKGYIVFYSRWIDFKKAIKKILCRS